MRRLTACLALLALAGCRKEQPQVAPPPVAPAAAPAKAPAEAPAPQAPRPVGPTGSVRGTVHFQGPVPAAKAARMETDPFCARQGSPSQEVQVAGGRLAHVVVRLTGDNVPQGEVPAEPVVVDQQGCQFRPRVQAAMAGQTVRVRNSDGTLHNVASFAGSRSLFNRAQPPGASPMDTTFSDGSQPVKLQCHVHPWMLGWVVVVPHPWFDVSGEDGTFQLEGVPAGTYTLEAWHERLGTRTAQVTVTPGSPAEVRFTFAAGDAG